MNTVMCRPRNCIDCAFCVRSSQATIVCIYPDKIGQLSTRIWVDAALVRANQFECGPEGRWFEEKTK